MIRKIINKDGTFGANYDEALKKEYQEQNVWPEENYIELTPEQASLLDANSERYIYKAEVPGLFIGNPFGVIEDPEYQARELDAARHAKYSEIISEYEYANQYYVCNLYGNVYGNVSWIPTWNKVISYLELIKKDTLPSDLRLYQKEPISHKFKNIKVSNVSLAEFKRYRFLLEQVQFEILQPKKTRLCKMLNIAKTLKEIKDIKVSYGYTLNESDPEDTNKKLEL